jgi:DNA helicase-2/ATP-dependent DNA helicase PcrA
MAQRSLTKEQEEVVLLPPGPWLVTAPPGCGKTEVLVRRVEHLLSLSGRARSRVLVLTFTRRAAESVIQRIQAALPEHAERVAANRFHQFCFEVLRQQAPDRVRTLYEGKAERLLALQRALEEEGLAPTDASDLEALLGRIELAKKTLEFEQPNGIEDEAVSLAFAAYVRYQQRERVCDFDDLVLDVLELFREEDWRVEAYRRLYESVLVDEAQDLNASQYALVEALLGRAPHDVMFLADHRQSIYAFNGADLAILDAFVTRYGAGRRKLTLSFRCGRRIVRAANAIAALLQRTPDSLSDDVSLAEGAIEAMELSDERAEANWIAERIERLLQDGLPSDACHPGEELLLAPNDIAVLGRSRRSIAASEEVLRGRLGDVVTSYGRDDVLASSLGMAALWCLRAVAHPNDAIVRRQLVTHTLGNYTAPTPSSLDDALQLICTSDSVIASLARTSLNRTVDEALVRRILVILESEGAKMEAQGSNEDEALASDVDWLSRLRLQLRRRLQREPSVSEFTQELTFTTATPVEGRGVRVLTMHAAKGQEFRVVFVAGLREGSFPSFFAKTERQLDEERRLAYVAVTRASRLLVVSRARTWTTSYGNQRFAAPSPYFSEIQAIL